MKSVVSDLRQGLHLMVGSPWVSSVAVATLALGIAASTAMLGVFHTVVLRPLPFDEPQRVVRIWESRLGGNGDRSPVSPPNFADWRAQSKSFDAMAAYSSWNPALVDGDGATRLPGLQVTTELFSLLGVDASVGRFLVPSDRGGHVVVISHAMWQHRFGARADVLGRTMVLNGDTYTIIGVMPEAFQFPPGAERRDVWVPLDVDGNDAGSRATRYLQVIARLKANVSLAMARSELSSIAAQLAARHAESNGNWTTTVVPFHAALVGNTRPAMAIMLGAVGFVLLIACANVASLMLARTSGRQRELAMRLILGATPHRLVRQLLMEGIVLASVGGAMGVALAVAASRLIVASAPASIPRLNEFSLDASVLGVSLALSLSTVLLFALVPALLTSRLDVNQIVKETTGVAGSPRGMRFRRGLVVVEVALAFVLLVGAGAMLKAFMALLGTDPGFRPQGVLSAQVNLPSLRYESPERQRAFFLDLVERARTIPGVGDVGLVSYLPFAGSNMEWSFRVSGRAAAVGATRFAEYRQVSAGYFQTMGVVLLQGRVFDDSDAAGSHPVIIVNQAFVRQAFPGEEALHKVVGFGRKPEWREVVGVVADVRHFGLDSAAKPEAYVPHQQDPWPSMTLVVRAESDKEAMARALRRSVAAIDAQLPLYNVRTMDALVTASLAPRRLTLQLLALFSGIALLLATVGVFGVMANDVSQRTREFGIRLALGALPETILRTVVRHAVLLALAGIALGLGAALVLGRFLVSWIHGVQVADPLVLGVAAIALALALIAASLVPGRRATRVDPMVALRCD